MVPHKVQTLVEFSLHQIMFIYSLRLAKGDTEQKKTYAVQTLQASGYWAQVIFMDSNWLFKTLPTFEPCVGPLYFISFLLLSGTSSTLRTFLGGTSQKRHPLDKFIFQFYNIWLVLQWFLLLSVSNARNREKLLQVILFFAMLKVIYYSTQVLN